MSDDQDAVPRLSAAKARRERRARLMSQSLPELVNSSPKKIKVLDRSSKNFSRDSIPEESPAKSRPDLKEYPDSSMSTLRSFFTKIGWNSSSTPQSRKDPESRTLQEFKENSLDTPSKESVHDKQPAQHPHYLGETPLIRRQPIRRSKLDPPTRFRLNESASSLGPPKNHSVAPDGSPIKELPPITWDSNESMSIINAYKQALERQLKLEKKEKAKLAKQSPVSHVAPTRAEPVSDTVEAENNISAEDVQQPTDFASSELNFREEEQENVENLSRKRKEMSPSGSSPTLKKERLHKDSPKPKFFEQLDQLLKSPNVRPSVKKNRRSTLRARIQDIPRIPLKVRPALELKDITEDRKRKGGFFMADIDYSDEEIQESPKKRMRRASDENDKKLLPANGIKINISALADEGRYLDRTLMKETRNVDRQKTIEDEKPATVQEAKIPLPKFIMDEKISSTNEKMGNSDTDKLSVADSSGGSGTTEPAKTASAFTFGAFSGSSMNGSQKSSEITSHDDKKLIPTFGQSKETANNGGQDEAGKKRLFSSDNDLSMKKPLFGDTDSQKAASLFGTRNNIQPVPVLNPSSTPKNDSNSKENHTNNVPSAAFSFSSATNINGTNDTASGLFKMTDKTENAAFGQGKSLFGGIGNNDQNSKSGFVFGKSSSSLFGNAPITDMTKSADEKSLSKVDEQKASPPRSESTKSTTGISLGTDAGVKPNGFTFGTATASFDAPKSLFGSSTVPPAEKISFGVLSTKSPGEPPKSIFGGVTGSTGATISFGATNNTSSTTAPANNAIIFGSNGSSKSDSNTILKSTSDPAPFSFNNKDSETKTSDKQIEPLVSNSDDGNVKSSSLFGSARNENEKVTSLFDSSAKQANQSEGNQLKTQNQTSEKPLFGNAAASFGSKNTSEIDKPVQNSTFSFAKPADVSNNAMSESPFGFDKSTTEQNKTVTETSKPAFNFGASFPSSNGNSSTAFGSTTTVNNSSGMTSTSNAFNFGSKPTDQARSSAPPFGFGNQPAFGNGSSGQLSIPDTNQRSSQPPATTTAFTFGSTQSTNGNAFNMNTVPSFNFGNNNANSNFTFGSSSQASTAPAPMLPPQSNGFTSSNTGNNMFAPVTDSGAAARRKIMPLPRRRRNA